MKIFTTVVIDKETVLKALRTEPLRTGRWFGLVIDDPQYKFCSVCAVGAVVRTAGLVPIALATGRNPASIASAIAKNHGCSDGTKVASLLKKKNYFGALSQKFENETQDREKLCAFVKRYFPKEIKIKF